MTTYEELLETYKKDIAANRLHDAVYHVMEKMDELGRARKYDELQAIMDQCVVEDWNIECLHTIQLVTWWHGDKVERDDFLTRSEAYFVKLKGEKYTKKLMDGIKSKSWKPMFGGTWEKDLLTGAE
jgi:hypothetical protein